MNTSTLETTISLHQYAIELATAGYPVFPKYPRSKKPATENGFYDATTDIDQINEWWEENPDYNIGIPTGKVSGLVVLDREGITALDGVMKRYADPVSKIEPHLPFDTPKALSGRGRGAGHIYLQYEEGINYPKDEWLTDHPDCRLVVVDTIKKFRSRKRAGKNAYDVEYEDLEPLLKLTHKHSTSILVVTHFRKDTEVDDPYDAISGSTGLTGAVDGVMLLQRERGAADAFLYVDGRDIEDSQKFALRWDSQINNWSIQGDAEKYKMSPERREIVEFLEQKNATGPVTAMGPTAIAKELGKNDSTVKNTLPKMVKDKQLVNQGGKYYVDYIDCIDSVDPVDSVDQAWFE